VAQVVVCPPSKFKAMSSDPSPVKMKNIVIEKMKRKIEKLRNFLK
jgi:uncharacterized protein (DUF2225 family)